MIDGEWTHSIEIESMTRSASKPGPIPLVASRREPNVGWLDITPIPFPRDPADWRLLHRHDLNQVANNRTESGDRTSMPMQLLQPDQLFAVKAMARSLQRWQLGRNRQSLAYLGVQSSGDTTMAAEEPVSSGIASRRRLIQKRQDALVRGLAVASRRAAPWSDSQSRRSSAGSVQILSHI